MAVNKNFVVKNGLEVNEDLIVANATDSFVGVGTSTPNNTLYVQGDARITGDLIADDINLDQAEFTNINVTGFTTTGELVVGMGASVTGITTLGHLNRAAAGSGGTSVTFNPAAGIATNLQIIGNTYIEGDLKIQSDLEVDADLFIVGIITAGTVHVGSAFSSAGVSTFMSDVNIGGKVQTGLEIAGVTTTASSGGITTTGGDLFVGNNLFIKDDITVDTNLNILGVATVGVLSARDAVVSGGSTVNGNVTIGGTTAGIGSIFLPDDSRISFGTGAGDLFIYHDGSNSRIHESGTGGLIIQTNNFNLDNAAGTENLLTATENGAIELYHDNTVRFETTNTGAVVTGILTATGIGSFASSVNVVGAQFVGGNLTVGGDLDVTGDISLDEIDARNLNVTGIATAHTLGVTSTTTTTDLSVGAAATVGGVLKVSDTTDSTTKDTGAVIIEGGVGIEKNLNLGTTIKMDATSGVITATTFSGVGELLGIGSEGTPIGSGVSFIDFRSSTGTAFSCQPAVNGIATVTVTPGVSLGLAIALGG